jgi:endoglucanase
VSAGPALPQNGGTQLSRGAAEVGEQHGVGVSNFHTTSPGIGHDRQVLAALGGPADGAWCDPAGRSIGREPTLSTGEALIDAYPWVKLPGESDGCKGPPGTFGPS